MVSPPPTRPALIRTIQCTVLQSTFSPYQVHWGSGRELGYTGLGRVSPAVQAPRTTPLLFGHAPSLPDRQPGLVWIGWDRPLPLQCDLSEFEHLSSGGQKAVPGGERLKQERDDYLTTGLALLGEMRRLSRIKNCIKK